MESPYLGLPEAGRCHLPSKASVFSMKAGSCTHFTVAGPRGRVFPIQMFGGHMLIGKGKYSCHGNECF